MPAARPLLARRGQISMFTSGLLHSGTPNHDTTARKLLVLSWSPRGLGLPPHPTWPAHVLRRKLAPEREHIAVHQQPARL